jgi:hypothetical protein
MAAPTKTGHAPSAGRGRFARSTVTPRRSGPLPRLHRHHEPEPSGLKKVVRVHRRPEPEPSGLKKVVGALVPTAAAKKAAPSSKKGKAGGLALVAAAAGVAFKNRDKISGRRKQSAADGATAMKNAATPPATPAP